MYITSKKRYNVSHWGLTNYLALLINYFSKKSQKSGQQTKIKKTAFVVFCGITTKKRGVRNQQRVFQKGIHFPERNEAKTDEFFFQRCLFFCHKKQDLGF
jgi:hypothetical protein